jgi:isopenicillin N synthase-like dioxygenase
MQNTKMSIPVINFSKLSSLDGYERTKEAEEVGRELYEALSTIGFAYISNHGIEQDIIDKAFTAAGNFFALPESVKRTFARKDFAYNHGWDALEVETLDPEHRPADFKECYVVMPQQATVWPDGKDLVPHFQRDSMALYDRCVHLSQRILFAMALGLQLPDPGFFCSKHNTLDRPSMTCMRYQHYPSLANVALKPLQVRCGEHTDYGSITVLFQDDVGGLEVLSRDGHYVQAKPMPGTVLINIADLMQRWTGDRLVSTRHRVPIPQCDQQFSKRRLSISFFVNPDNDSVVETVGGGTVYPPITCMDYLSAQYDITRMMK